MYTTFLFDLDGTLIESESQKIYAKQKAIAEIGGHVSFDQVTEFVGKSEEEVCAGLLRLAGIDGDWRAISQKAEQLYIETITDGLVMNPGALSYLTELKSLGHTLGLVTSSTPRMLEHNPTVARLISLFDVVVHADSVAEHKPSPAPYLKALDLLGVPAHTAVAFEDSGSGFASALAANIPCVLYRHLLNLNVDSTKAIFEISNYMDPRLQQLND